MKDFLEFKEEDIKKIYKIITTQSEEEVDFKELQEDLVGITLPKELLAKTRTTLRPAADTIVSAIYNYRRVTHGN